MKFYKKKKNTFLSALVISVGVLLSRFTGLIRDVVFASFLGTGIVAEAFYVAFRLPNTFRRIFAEGAFSNIFVPFFSSKITENHKIANHFSAKILKILFLFLIIITIFIEVGMPYVIKVINPGFLADKEKFNLAVSLSRIAFPYVVLISITAFFGSILNSVNSFWQFSIVSVILNIVLFIGLYLTNSFFSNSGICLSYLLIVAGCIQVIFVAYFCVKKHIFPAYSDDKLELKYKIENNRDVKSFLKKLLPAVISSGILQINIFVDGIFASFFAGAVSYLYYTDRIGQFPLSIIGYSLSVAILPALSIAFKKNNKNDIVDLQTKSFNIAVFFSIPAMLLILMLSKPIIELIYQHGAFNADDTEIVAKMLAIYAISIPFNVLLKILFSCFYANKDTKPPMQISIISLIFNIICNIILIKFVGMYCVVISTTSSSILSYLMAILLLKKNGVLYINKKCSVFFVKILLISLLSCCLIPYFFYDLNLIIILIIVGLIHVVLCFGAKILTIDFLRGLIRRD